MHNELSFAQVAQVLHGIASNLKGDSDPYRNCAILYPNEENEDGGEWLSLKASLHFILFVYLCSLFFVAYVVDGVVAADDDEDEVAADDATLLLLLLLLL